ncbi:cortexin domain-containing 1 protein-like [Hoplias malabaricus]|uniref:cortexin domain-containing 1 protein-like n=1 Tax=Hoplias malabaricus TaxID=27720 RepID=UPI0034620935
MDQPVPPVSWLDVDVDLGFALFFLFLLCLFLFIAIIRCAQTVVDPYGAISTSTYEGEQINN